jgi:5-formyltetrahydrofolate cyclo-ligase
MIQREKKHDDASKEEIRARTWERLFDEKISQKPFGRIPPFEGQNRAAERLRRWPLYRETTCVMIPPDEALFQVRLNAMRDMKRLLMASPGLREGFYELRSQTIPDGSWPHAVRTTGMTRYGRKLPAETKALGRVDLLITGAVAVDERGGRVGKGHGYFDLEYGILRQLGCIAEETPVVGLVHDTQIIKNVPIERGDVALDWIVTPDDIIQCAPGQPKPLGIPWERLSQREIRRIKPLWEIRIKESAPPIDSPK